jgi:hypothetical protein
MGLHNIVCLSSKHSEEIEPYCDVILKAHQEPFSETSQSTTMKAAIYQIQYFPLLNHVGVLLPLVGIGCKVVVAKIERNRSITD